MTKEQLRMLRANVYGNGMLAHRAYHERKIAFAVCHHCACTLELLKELDAALKEDGK